MSIDSLMDKSTGSKISTYCLMGKYLGYGMYLVRVIIFYLSYSSTAILTFYPSYSAEGLHFFLCCRQQQLVHEHSRTIRTKSMISANGGTYAGPYPCDGWVDKLKPTLLIAMICFWILQHKPKKTINELPTR